MRTALRTLCILFFCGHVSAQELPPVVNYTTNDYSAGNQNWMVSQTANKVIYVANNNGLLQFNGAQWTLYPTPNGSIMRSVKCDANRIYTGCYMDFGYWEPNENGTLAYQSIIEQTGVKLQEDEQFWDIFIEDGYVLFQSLNALYSYDITAKSLTNVVSNAQISKFFKVDERFFYQDLNKGLLEIKNGKGQILSSDPFFKEKVVIKFFKVQSQLLFITSDNTIYELENTTPKLVAVNAFTNGVRVYSAQLLSDDTLMLGTISHGIVNVNLNGTVNYSLDASNGLVNNTGLSLFEDLDKNVWVGLDNGISTLSLDSGFKTFKDENGKLGTVYTSLYDNGFIYIGTNQGLFVKKDGEQKFSMIESTQGQVWVLKKINGFIFCGHNDGTFIINGKNASYVKNTAGVWDLQGVENQPDLILQGAYAGFYMLQREGDSWVLRNKLEGFNISSKDFALDGSTIYVSHEYKGVFKIELNEDLTTAKNVTLLKKLGKGITSDILALNGDVIYANSKGVFIKSKGSNDFRKDNTLSAIYNKGYISSTLVKDNANSFWIFTKNHLNKITRQQINGTYKVESIPLEDYVRSEKRGYENLTAISGNHYLLGSSYGYMMLNMNGHRKIAHKVFINSVVNAKGNEQIAKALNQPVTVTYEDNNVTIFFNTPVYEGYHNAVYRYKISGDADWSDWDSATSTSFKNLDHGNYTFEVQSMVNSNLSDNIAVIQITVERPYYLSNWAIAIYVLLLLAIVALINKLYNRYFKKQQAEALEKQQKELELRNLENEKDLIKLRNDKLRADIDARNRELAVSTMSMIKKNETLNEIKLELEKLQSSSQVKSVKKLVEDNLGDKQDWITFEKAFNNADKDFFQKIKELHPSLSSGDLRLCVYLRLNLSSKEIAPLLNISPRSVEIKRYRLRKKLGLDRDDSLSSYIVEI